LLVLSKLFIYKNIKLTFKLMFKKNCTPNKLSMFQALSSALAATVGMGNIAGVAVAIINGGPGAIFWMWISGIIGLNLKFFETASAISSRTEVDGVYIGGAMYTIKHLSKSKIGKILSWVFAICGCIGTLSMFQINQLSQLVNTHYQISNLHTGTIVATLLFFIIFGGFKRIGVMTSVLVPLMCVVYFLSCGFILWTNSQNIIPVFKNIINSAFNILAIGSGVVGYSIKEIIGQGFKRATFSNEAGLGTAPLAHIDSSNQDPVNEGLVSIIGVIIDTHVICTLTALTILCSGVAYQGSGIDIVAATFNQTYGKYGLHILMMSVAMFSFTTMLGMANYNYKCWGFVFGTNKKSKTIHNIYYICTVLVGAVVAPAIIIDFLDISYALMLIPNLYAIKLTLPKLMNDIHEYKR
jgi:AGCS family alanine or glycine:cation symporter